MALTQVFTVVALTIPLLFSCKTAEQSALKNTVAVTEPPAWSLELGEEPYVDGEGNDEAYWIQKLVVQSDVTVSQQHASTGHAGRSAHAKSHGCVLGKLTIDENRPRKSKHGIFSEDGEYPLWIRFSNSTPANNHDKIPDGRGMAIKVINVAGDKLLPGEVDSNAVDLPFVSGPVFPVGNLKEYLALQKNPVTYLATHPIAALLTAEVGTQVMKSPLFGTYWSMGAFKLGPQAVKFKTWPCREPWFNFTVSVNPNYLRDAMVHQLTKNEDEACFEFGVQFQKDPNMMPVEDPTVEWRESKSLFSQVERAFGRNDPPSPFVKIARITIPAQTFATPEQDEFCDRLSFNPWRTLPEQRPLGNLMRARLAVYKASLKKRLELNQQPPVSTQLTGSQRDVTP
jgi:hypothetical protein